VSDSKASARPLAGSDPPAKPASRLAPAERRGRKGSAGTASARQEASRAKRAPAALGPEQEPLATSPGEGGSLYEGAPRIDLPEAGFEGPLDLLLHLIQQHELDILNIPVSFITERYLNYINVMRSLSIDIASEYLVMAATLTHIKSKMLLPSVPSGQEDDALHEEEDPREELVRRLLEYQKYKAAAVDLGERGTLGRDVFTRGITEPVPQSVAPFAEVGVFSLLDAFERVLKRANVEINHEVVFDRISITDRIGEINDKLTQRKSMRFDDLFLDGKVPNRFDLVITFLSLLEMCKLRMIRVYQSDPLSPIHIELASQPAANKEAATDEASAGPEPAVMEEAAVVEASAPAPASDPAPAGDPAEPAVMVEVAVVEASDLAPVSEPAPAGDPAEPAVMVEVAVVEASELAPVSEPGEPAVAEEVGPPEEPRMDTTGDPADGEVGADQAGNVDFNREE
jgi:segregation and condensation protein A